MLSNVGDLTSETVVPRDAMEPLDRLACTVTDTYVDGIRRSYDAFALHEAYLRIVEFESSMSSLYFDALKDPLYSRALNDRRRRSAQSALLCILERLLVALAPVLSFTAEEAWQSVPEGLRGEAASVFDLELRDVVADRTAVERWQLLRGLRAHVAASESPRDFEAAVRMSAQEVSYEWLHQLGDNLREALVVSQLELTKANLHAFEILPASGEKCARCWKFRQLGSDPANPLVCSDCAEVLSRLDL
jgi:isoleucyl-tRNA synthetase